MAFELTDYQPYDFANRRHIGRRGIQRMGVDDPVAGAVHVDDRPDVHAALPAHEEVGGPQRKPVALQLLRVIDDKG